MFAQPARDVTRSGISNAVGRVSPTSARPPTNILNTDRRSIDGAPGFSRACGPAEAGAPFTRRDGLKPVPHFSFDAKNLALSGRHQVHVAFHRFPQIGARAHPLELLLPGAEGFRFGFEDDGPERRS